MSPTAQYNHDHNDFNEGNNEADKALLVRFYIKSVQDKIKSEAEGRPVFREKEYIEIRYPGNRTDAIARPASAKDIARFPRHYEAFKQRIAMPEEGTPLAEWPVVSRTQAEELAFYNIKTVEQLAGTTAANGSKFMGFNSLQEKAKKYLELSKQGVELGELQDELKKRDDTIAQMGKQLEALTERLNSQEQAVASGEEEQPDQPRETEAPKPRTSRRRRQKTE